MTAITIQLDDKVLGELDALAAKVERPREELLGEAVVDYLAFQHSQIEEIEAGLAEADRGEFASDEEVAAVFAKFGVAYGGGTG
jgi:predicted transcriptional regulator